MRTVTDALHLYRDGREVCRRDTIVGRALYRGRTLDMLKRQKGRCCLEFYCPTCTGFLKKEEASFEHEDGRGGGKRDDRIVLPDGRWINGAAHVLCDGWKGSRFIDYNRSLQDDRYSWVLKSW